MTTKQNPRQLAVVCSRDVPEKHAARLHEMAWLFNLVIDVFNLVILTRMTKLKVD